MVALCSFNNIATEAVEQYSFGDANILIVMRRYTHCTIGRLSTVCYTRKQPNRKFNIALQTIYTLQPESRFDDILSIDATRRSYFEFSIINPNPCGP